jgi:hypothetical protein
LGAGCILRGPHAPAINGWIGFGQELLSGLRLIAVLATLSGRRDLHEYLGRVSGVAIVESGGCDRNQEEHMLVHEALGDILRRFHDYSHRAVQLSEGFYSVACDYWLSWYLQWPFFREWVLRDVFRPYFELWARGCEIAFQGESLCIARHAEPLSWPTDLNKNEDPGSG